MQRGLRKGRVGPALKLAYQNGSGAGAGLAAGGTGSCMRPPQNLSNMCMSVLGLSQTWRLKTAEVYSVSVLEARRLRSGHPRRVPGACPWLPPALRGPLACGSVSLHGQLCVCVSEALPPFLLFVLFPKHSY